MPHIYMPCRKAEQWKDFLADPELHWQTGFSARTLAYSWSEADGFPAEVDSVLRAAPLFRDIELLLAIPEHQVPLPGGVRPSQNDVWVLARTGQEMVSIAVEGKVREPFDKPVREWRADASPNKMRRLEFLAQTVALPISALDDVHYQLLHRTASALLEAKRFRAAHAIMLVHSFSREREHYSAFEQFVSLFGHQAQPDSVISVAPRSEIALHFAWITGNVDYLRR
ncbi:MAG: hypothetical protein GF341_01750 [candidate division Zixibacteria bacterium]|nr:hypothetical protein [candidate division Zixibacteria bacterium]